MSGVPLYVLQLDNQLWEGRPNAPYFLTKIASILDGYNDLPHRQHHHSRLYLGYAIHLVFIRVKDEKSGQIDAVSRQKLIYRLHICTLSNFYNTPAAGLLTIHRGMLFQLRYSTSICRNNVAADFLAAVVAQQLQRKHSAGVGLLLSLPPVNQHYSIMQNKTARAAILVL